MSDVTHEVQVIPDRALSRFATALARHDVDFAQATDSRSVARGAAEYDEMVDLALGLPKGEALVLVELRARRQYWGDEVRATAYLAAFEAAMEKRIG